MVNDTTLQHLASKTLALLGLGREGLSTYRFLRQYFPDKQIFLYDEKSITELPEDWQAILNQNSNTHYQGLNSNNENIDHTLSNIVLFKSPGISLHSRFYQEVIALFDNPEVTSNTNLFFECMKDTATIIGITGTKGKSTTTSAIYHVLSNCPKHTVFLGGNIGVPPLDLIPDIELSLKKRDAEHGTTERSKDPLSWNGDDSQRPIVVLELSSHQLLNLQHSPHIAVIQEIVPEHLDYYQSFDEYVRAKAQIVKFQTSADIVIFNSKYSTPMQIAKTSQAQKLDVQELTSTENNTIKYKDETVVSTEELQVKGVHNILNILPAIVIAKQFSCSTAGIKEALQTFKPLKHRLELVGTVNGVEYYNDSLATTPEACIAALSAFPDKNIILIAGGYDRHLDFKELAAEIVKRNIKNLLLFKPTGDFIAQAVRNLSNIDIQFVETMQQAVELAHGAANTGDIVLMSPASASFGRFKDYADRGKQFEKAVKELK